MTGCPAALADRCTTTTEGCDVDVLMGIFQKSFFEMTMNERITVLLIIVACLFFVLYAISVLIQLSQKFDDKSKPVSVKKGLGRAGEIQEYEYLRVTHSD